MRKKVLGLVMAALAIGTTGAFAQSENQQSKATCEQVSENGECKKGKKECTKDSGECKKAKGDRHKGIKGDKKFRKDGRKAEKRDGKANPFEGIELTAEQQQQLDALRAERKAQKDAVKEAGKEAKAQQQQQYDEKIAQILTPEQYNQYKANREGLKDRKKAMKAKTEKMREGKKFEGKAKTKGEAIKAQ